jgi:hypothetical protein
MSMNEIYLRLTRIGEQADAICRQYPRDRAAMALRDLSTQVANAMLSLSPETRKRIASA